jgi:D-alanyl-D-alanine carboxypeptidase (penicillin-binding protein 5/6)
MKNSAKSLSLIIILALSAAAFITTSYAQDTTTESVFDHIAEKAFGNTATNSTLATNSTTGLTPTLNSTTPTLNPTATTSATPTLNTNPVPKLTLLPQENTPALTTPAAPVLPVHGYLLQDVYSGNILASQNPDQRMYPASLTKLMTTYIVFEALREGRIHLNDQVTISRNAWQTGGSRMFAQVGSTISVDNLIQGMIVQSGNDACVAMAEYIGGTADGFVNLMNQQAALLNMSSTHFQDCNGLPDPDHYTTPRDLAKLSRALILNFPEYYHYFGEKEFTFNNIKQPNRNRLLWRDPSVDGLKTGHTDEAGYCLIASAQRNGTRLLSVLLGAPTENDRVEFSEDLLNYGFRFFESHKIYDANAPLAQERVWYGQTQQLPIGVASPLFASTPTGQFNNVQVTMKINRPLMAPLSRGQTVGEINITLGKQLLSSTPLVALEDDAKANILVRLFDHISYFFYHLFNGNA